MKLLLSSGFEGGSLSHRTLINLVQLTLYDLSIGGRPRAGRRRAVLHTAFLTEGQLHITATMVRSSRLLTSCPQSCGWARTARISYSWWQRRLSLKNNGLGVDLKTLYVIASAATKQSQSQDRRLPRYARNDIPQSSPETTSEYRWDRALCSPTSRIRRQCQGLWTRRVSSFEEESAYRLTGRRTERCRVAYRTWTWYKPFRRTVCRGLLPAGEVRLPTRGQAVEDKSLMVNRNLREGVPWK